ncbi:helix-turn-helix domain-containing protein [Cronobacter sakazakii]|uniref:helix-turn-helix domain-containing protein n=1 Tax=Cronobacter sakazakii TaxID=28141 RepID=UPI000CFC4EA3|nr:helix-turn-helix transcriptional regulator [Cronobacter sakazakii]
MSETTNTPTVFCKRLKTAREAKGLSQKKLGILAGIDEFVASARINRYEKGVHQTSIEIACKLADALAVPLAYFYTEDDQLAELLLRWKQLDQDAKNAILSHIR